jgi:hypothetical protein
LEERCKEKESNGKCIDGGEREEKEGSEFEKWGSRCKCREIPT